MHEISDSELNKYWPGAKALAHKQLKTDTVWFYDGGQCLYARTLGGLYRYSALHASFFLVGYYQRRVPQPRCPCCP